MVCEWGMSEKLGPLTFGDKEGEIFLGRDMGHSKNYSEATAVEIDNEIRDIVQRNYERTRNILRENRAGLDRVAEALLERENLDGHELNELVFGSSEAGEEPSGKNIAPSEGGCVDQDSPTEDE
jgi:cell division protease FtsH